MFVFNWWKEMYAGSLEMAARNPFSPFSVGLPTEKAPLPASGESAGNEDVLTTLGELTFCTLTLKGEALALGENWKALTRLEPTQCAGTHFVDFFHPQHRPLFFRKLAELQQNPKEILRFRVQYGSTHASYGWYELTLALRTSHAGAEPVVAAVLRNISREMESERILRTAQIETELALRARAEFLGHMSHELRTPLNAILGFSEMMEIGVHGEIENQHYREYLANIRESGHMLLGRINDMLEVASIEVGDTEIHDGLFSPQQIIESAMQLHRHEAFCRRVTLKAAASEPAVMIRCDLAKITRALGNILANAIRFSKHKSVVELGCEMDAKGTIAFYVRDSGQGIAADHLAQLQEALERKASMFASCPEKVCLGLGLVVAKEFVCLHGGRLAIDSIKSQGTEVRLQLPKERLTSLESPRARRKRQVIMKDTA